MPVVGDGVDDVLGMLYLKDVARRVHERPDDAFLGHRRPGDARGPVRPRQQAVDSLLKQMQKQSGHIAVVVDEYGGTAGLVTLEDLVEEVHRRDLRRVRPGHRRAGWSALGEDAYRGPLSRLHVEELGDLYNLDLRDEEVDTVGARWRSCWGASRSPGRRCAWASCCSPPSGLGPRRNQLATVLVRREPRPTTRPRRPTTDGATTQGVRQGPQAAARGGLAAPGLVAAREAGP